MSGSSRRTATDFSTWPGQGALQWRLLLVKGEAHRDNRVVAALDAGDEARLQGNATFAREVRGVTGAAQQALHLARAQSSFSISTSALNSRR